MADSNSPFRTTPFITEHPTHPTFSNPYDAGTNLALAIATMQNTVWRAAGYIPANNVDIRNAGNAADSNMPRSMSPHPHQASPLPSFNASTVTNAHRLPSHHPHLHPNLYVCHHYHSQCERGPTSTSAFNASAATHLHLHLRHELQCEQPWQSMSRILA
ncbi:hypothetical protein BDQ12DRAFT_443750 [Crucibulum laeve]|uniref:Uncharacterized protein n=1 Tax=Crucibulum laeve TaxID=68775 RepID=A0A5C3LKU9_9AGAR|nr:hypothetical protein BDQ12DRAFT_443750 [Crucibulum laeve]